MGMAYYVVIWILCIFGTIVVYSQDQLLEAFCQSRNGHIDGKVCFYFIDKETNWDDARSKCRMPDQNPNSDLFYSDKKEVAEKVLKQFTNDGTKKSKRFWTAASKVHSMGDSSKVYWRRCGIPDWLVKVNEQKTQRDDGKIKHLMIELQNENGVPKLHLHFDHRDAYPLCRYSPKEDLACAPPQIITLEPTTESENETTTTVSETGTPTTESETGTPTTDSETETPTTETFTTIDLIGGCNSTIIDGIFWPAIQNGTELEQACPLGYNGTVIRVCDEDNERDPFKPNYDNCTFNWIYFDQEDNSADVMQQLVNATENYSLLNFGHLKDLQDTINDLVDKLKDELNDLTVDERGALARTFLQYMLDIWGNIFNEKKTTLWQTTDQKTEIVGTAVNAMKSIEDVGRIMACNLNETGTVRSPFIFVRTFNLTNSMEGITLHVGDQRITLPKFLTEKVEKCGIGSVNEFGSVGVAIQYTNIASKLIRSAEKGIEFSSEVIGFSVQPNQAGYVMPPTQRVTIEIPIAKPDNNRTRVCTYWNFLTNKWDRMGCKTKDGFSNNTYLVCECRHLTNFGAIIVNKTESETGSGCIDNCVSSETCLSEDVAGVHWPELQGGKNDTQECPAGFIGNATWGCYLNGDRITNLPNYENCVKRNWISDAVEGKDSINGSLDLAEATEKNEIENVDDLNVLRNKTKHLVAKFNEEFDNLSAEDKEKLAGTFLQSMLNIWSNCLDEGRNSAWNNVTEKTAIVETAVEAMKQIEDVGRTFACHAHENSAEGKNIIVRTFKLENTEKNITFESSDQLVVPELVFTKIENCTNGFQKMGVGVEYKNIAYKLLPRENRKIENISATVIGFSLTSNQETSKLPSGKFVKITQRLDATNDNDSSRVCSFWDFSKNKWSSEGCEKDRFESNETHVVCYCDHLTNFASLIIHRDLKVPESKVLTVLTYIGCTCSAICLIFTIACLTGFQELRCRRNTITTNLCCTLLALNLLVLFGLTRDEKWEPKGLCLGIAIGLHYTLLSSFAWMLMEGYLLYQMIVVVFSEVLNIKMRWFYLLGYGFPLIVVIVSLGVKHRRYVSSERCWLAIEDGIIWSFLGPALAIIFVNAVVFVCAMKAASEVRKKKLHNSQTLAVGWLKGSFSTMCLLGLTWVIGYFYFSKATEWVLYVFTILNSLQGVFIFVFHVVLNEKTRSTIVRMMKTRTGSNMSATSAKTTRTFIGGSFLSSNSKRSSGSSMSSNISSRIPVS